MSSVCLLSIYITFFSLLPFSSIDYLMEFMLVFTAIQSRYILGYFPSVPSLQIIMVLGNLLKNKKDLLELFVGYDFERIFGGAKNSRKPNSKTIFC